MTYGEPVLEFTIDRSLLTDLTYFHQGCACSMGEYLRACGVEDAFCVPASIEPLNALYATEVGGTTAFLRIANSNDKLFTTKDPDERARLEARIIEGFDAAGITATFVGKYA